MAIYTFIRYTNVQDVRQRCKVRNIRNNEICFATILTFSLNRFIYYTLYIYKRRITTKLLPSLFTLLLLKRYFESSYIYEKYIKTKFEMSKLTSACRFESTGSVDGVAK